MRGYREILLRQGLLAHKILVFPTMVVSTGILLILNTRAYLSKHVAYCTPEIGAQLHRRRGFRVQMNGDPKYPQMIQVLEEISLPKAERKKAVKVAGTA